MCTCTHMCVYDSRWQYMVVEEERGREGDGEVTVDGKIHDNNKNIDIYVFGKVNIYFVQG